MSRVDVESEAIIQKLVSYLATHHLIADQETYEPSNIFSSDMHKIYNPNTITIVLVTVNYDVPNTYSRRLLESDPLVATGNAKASTNDNVIYVKPDALFGIGLSAFIFFVAYVGAMCLFNVNTPKGFASKPFKFGREM